MSILDFNISILDSYNNILDSGKCVLAFQNTILDICCLVWIFSIIMNIFANLNLEYKKTVNTTQMVQASRLFQKFSSVPLS